MVPVLWIMSGMLAGWIAGMLLPGGYGRIGDFLLVLLGGLGGGLAAGFLSLPPDSWLEQIMVAALGGALFVWLLHVLHTGLVDI